MGCKGKKRREKNYKAAHGGNSGLPPPPDLKQLDALPSKLRQLIALTGTGATAFAEDRKKVDRPTQNVKQGDTSGQLKETQHTDSGDKQLSPDSENNKKNKKRKRKEVKDLRFEAEVNKKDSKLKKKERKKQYLEKKKKKFKKVVDEDVLEFPKHEKIEFGDVVQAPPKLVVPKGFKKAQDAYQERLRLEAIEAYRSRKKWSQRPGSHLPSLALTSDP